MVAVAGLAWLGGSALADEAAAGFPVYSREDVARVCLSEYGTENTSIIDCLANDQTARQRLSRKWADIDEGYRKHCLALIAGHDAKSYARLDRCVRSAEQEARAPAEE